MTDSPTHLTDLPNLDSEFFPPVDEDKLFNPPRMLHAPRILMLYGHFVNAPILALQRKRQRAFFVGLVQRCASSIRAGCRFPMPRHPIIRR